MQGKEKKRKQNLNSEIMEEDKSEVGETNLSYISYHYLKSGKKCPATGPVGGGGHPRLRGHSSGTRDQTYPRKENISVWKGRFHR